MEMKDALNVLPERRVQALDKGYVEIVDVSPRLVSRTPEEAIIQAARVSYANDSVLKSEQADAALIRYLIENKHTSPLEMVEFKFKMCVPLAIATQILRHRTASVNAMSHRYTNADQIFGPEDTKIWYSPFKTMEDVRLQDNLNKQGSISATESDLEKQKQILEIFQQMDVLTEQMYQLYSKATQLGAAREVARFYLPTGTYTMLYWKMDLHNLLHFLRLRMASEAQYEVRVYADAIYKLISPLVPNCIAAFEDTHLESVTFTPAEKVVLAKHLEVSAEQIVGSFKGSARRREQFKKKVEQLFE